MLCEAVCLINMRILRVMYPPTAVDRSIFKQGTIRNSRLSKRKYKRQFSGRSNILKNAINGRISKHTLGKYFDTFHMKSNEYQDFDSSQGGWQCKIDSIISFGCKAQKTHFPENECLLFALYNVLPAHRYKPPMRRWKKERKEWRRSGIARSLCYAWNYKKSVRWKRK